MAAPVYIILLHYPIVDKNGKTVTTSVTNMDLHDISRTARTYCVKGFFVVTPVLDQHDLIGRILSHWARPGMRDIHPDRVEALSLVRLIRDFDSALAEIEKETGERPEVVMPDARPLDDAVSYEDYRKELLDPDRSRPAVIVFGTGWGIDPSFFGKMDRILKPIYGPEGRKGYNHLSVRSAAAIVLDRLLRKI